VYIFKNHVICIPTYQKRLYFFATFVLTLRDLQLSRKERMAAPTFNHRVYSFGFKREELRQDLYVK
jgi:hypothetical protein